MRKELKVLHVIAGDLNGGAARGAYWLHLGLLSIGTNSRLLTNSKSKIHDDDNIVYVDLSKRSLFNSVFRKITYSIIRFLYPNRKRQIFSSGFFGMDLTNHIDYKKSDIIHLHWINADLLSIKEISKIKKPIVWTVRDMWPLTGGCHYSMGCNNFTSGCGNCLQLRSLRKHDLSRLVVNNKKKYFNKEMKIIGISNWICGLAMKSSVFNGFDIRYIPNNINTELFYSTNKKTARHELGIITSMKVVLVGAKGLDDFYKGFDKFIESLEFLDKDKFFLCFFGKATGLDLNGLGFMFKEFGHVVDECKLRSIYNAADVFVAPSLMEAFGKTLAESMACGTPVVCFNATGPKDIVDHKINGYLARPFVSADLAEGVKWVTSSSIYDELCANAKNKADNCFNNLSVAKQYASLYKELAST